MKRFMSSAASSSSDRDGSAGLLANDSNSNCFGSAEQPVSDEGGEMQLNKRSKHDGMMVSWLQLLLHPTFEVAYPGPKWVPMNEEMSKNMYAAFRANTPGYYTEELTSSGKEGAREYSIDWEQMIQTNIGNGRQRSVRFHPHESENTNQQHRRILTGKMR